MVVCVSIFNLMYSEDKLRINTYMIFLKKKTTIMILEGREEF